MDLWRERLHAAPDAVGRTLTIEGKPHVIVGPSRAGLSLSRRDAQMWTRTDDPTRLDPTVQGGVWLSVALGRLKPGVTAAQAAAEGTAAARSVPRPPVLDACSVRRRRPGAGPRRGAREGDDRGGEAGAPRPGRERRVHPPHRLRQRGESDAVARRGARQRELALRAALGPAVRASRAAAHRKRRPLWAPAPPSACCSAWALVRSTAAMAPADFRACTTSVSILRTDWPVIVTLLAALATGLVPAIGERRSTCRPRFMVETARSRATPRPARAPPA